MGGAVGEITGAMAADRRWREETGAEYPSPLASIGRGYMDMWEPLAQAWHDRTNPEEGRRYRKKRDDDEALYQRGLLGMTPSELRGAIPDAWRGIGRAAVMAPFAGAGVGIGGALGNAAKAGIGGEWTKPVIHADDIWRFINAPRAQSK
jgi:hypothetical protein